MCGVCKKKSSKKSNKPKKSVGKSVIKKSFPSVCQAIEKQVPTCRSCLLSDALMSSFAPYWFAMKPGV